MTDDEAQQWAEQWIAEWNRRDVEAVLAHFADDVEFSSPLVVTVVGEPSGIVRGRDALRSYWNAALDERPELHFELEDVHLGVGALVIHYRSAGKHMSEVAVFDADGKVARGWGLYGAN